MTSPVSSAVSSAVNSSPLVPVAASANAAPLLPGAGSAPRLGPPDTGDAADPEAAVGGRVSGGGAAPLDAKLMKRAGTTPFQNALALEWAAVLGNATVAPPPPAEPPPADTDAVDPASSSAGGPAVDAGALATGGTRSTPPPMLAGAAGPAATGEPADCPRSAATVPGLAIPVGPPPATAGTQTELTATAALASAEEASGATDVTPELAEAPRQWQVEAGTQVTLELRLASSDATRIATPRFPRQPLGVGPTQVSAQPPPLQPTSPEPPQPGSTLVPPIGTPAASTPPTMADGVGGDVAPGAVPADRPSAVVAHDFSFDDPRLAQPPRPSQSPAAPAQPPPAQLPTPIDGAPGAGVGPTVLAAAGAPEAPAAAPVATPRAESEAQVDTAPSAPAAGEKRASRGATEPPGESSPAPGEPPVRQARPSAGFGSSGDPTGSGHGPGSGADPAAAQAPRRVAARRDEKLTGGAEPRSADPVAHTLDAPATPSPVRADGAIPPSSRPSPSATDLATSGAERAEGAPPTTLRMTLEPPEGGTVEVRLEVRGDSVHAQIVTADGALSSSLSSGRDDLREHLRQQHLALGGLDVSTGGGSSHGSRRESRDAETAAQAGVPVPGPAPLGHAAASARRVLDGPEPIVSGGAVRRALDVKA